jgi:AcrR family transcriptional regulator
LARPRGPLDPERTRQALLVAATEQFAKNGYSATTLRAVADAAGIGAPSLLYHYESKDALFDAVLVEAWSGVRSRIMARLPEAETPEQILGIAYLEMLATEAADGALLARLSAGLLDAPQLGAQAIRTTLVPLLETLAQAIKACSQDPVRPDAPVVEALIYVMFAHAAGLRLSDRVGHVVEGIEAHEMVFAAAVLASLR